MITVNNVEKRNLEEQVLKNKADIDSIRQAEITLASWGIRVVGHVLTENDLPNDDPEKAEEEGLYGGTYGDAYAVGSESPYIYQIWTRANDDKKYPHWFKLGEFPLEGPKGDKGDTGAQGAQGASTQWFTESTDPYTFTQEMNIGDLWLNTESFQVFRLTTIGDVPTWISVGTIKGNRGQQGLPGPVGPQGPAGQNGVDGKDGTSFIIKGHLHSIEELEQHPPVRLSDAYLVDQSDGTHLYVSIESQDPDKEYEWSDTGLLSGGTNVTVGGQYQQTWNADNKVNTSLLADTATANTVALRNAGGRVRTADPIETYDALNYQYMNQHIPNKASWDVNDVPVYNGSNTWTRLVAAQATTGYALVLRDGDGQISVKTPTSNNHAAGKGYVDNLIPDIEVV